METYPTKGHIAYHIPHLTDENRLFWSCPYNFYKIIRKDNNKEYFLRVCNSWDRDAYD